jgi:hypothetical protein
MREPSFEMLAEMKRKNEPSASYASNLNTNPRHHKYRWWVFHEGCTVEGADFLKRENSLCTHEAMMLMDRLRKENKPYIVYNVHDRRLGEDTPFRKDEESVSRHDWAPAFDDDPDPIWEGHK